MNAEQLSFVNQQLAGMLRTGIPLEGALKQLCGQMRPGLLRRELEALEGDLAEGKPFAEAIAGRKLPPLYVRLLTAGARGGDLPSMLIWMADYYQRSFLLWAKLKTLLVYPSLVLLSSGIVSTLLAVILSTLLGEVMNLNELIPGGGSSQGQALLLAALWLPTGLVLGVFALMLLLWMVPRFRAYLRWTLPGFKEGSIAQVSAALALLLRGGCPLGEALALVQRLEGRSPAAQELSVWLSRMSAGLGRITEMAAESRVLPPLFVWLVAQSGDDLAQGFDRAAEIYRMRANYRTDLFLATILPVSVVAVALLVVSQFVPLFQFLARFMDNLGM
jgi:type II secretory pathway component PulF